MMFRDWPKNAMKFWGDKNAQICNSCVQILLFIAETKWSSQRCPWTKLYASAALKGQMPTTWTGEGGTLSPEGGQSFTQITPWWTAIASQILFVQSHPPISESKSKQEWKFSKVCLFLFRNLWNFFEILLQARRLQLDIWLRWSTSQAGKWNCGTTGNLCASVKDVWMKQSFKPTSAL